MTDYVIKFSGQDNLSSTLNNIKSEIKDVGKSTTALEDISKKFQRIQNSSAPLKKQLRDLKAIMADMNMKGLAGTDQYTKIAQEAGRIKDAMDDATAATKRFSDDTFALTATGDAMQVIAGAGSVAAGAMSMFGVESDKVQQAILKVQSAIAILNGVQAIANKLNKDGALMQALKTVRINAATVAQGRLTAATNAGTAAQIKNNLAVLANPYVAAAAAIAALAAGIYYYSKKANEATDTQKGLDEAVKASADATSKGYEAYKKQELELSQLQQRLDNFKGSKEEEKKLVDELNNKYGTALGKYKDLDSWKKAVANTSYYYCKVLQAEAKLTALNTEAASSWAKAMAGEDVEKNMAKYKALQGYAEAAMDDVLFYKNQLNIAQRLSGAVVSSSPSKGSGGSGRSSSKSTTSQPDPVFKANANTLQDMQNNVTILKNQLKTLDINSDKFKEVSTEIEKWEFLIKNAGKDWKQSLDSEIKPSLDTLIKDIPKLEGLSFHLPDHHELLMQQLKDLEGIAEAAGQAASAFGQLGSAIGGTAGDAIGAFGNIAATIAQTIGQVVSLMIANGVSSAMSLPFPANLVAAATVMAGLASIIASIKNAASGNFAEGGIVGGSSMVGDRLIARVNSGEMILNGSQQRNLFNLLDNGGGISNSSGQVEFKISGSTLKGVLRNYDNKMSKIR